ncbi:MAG: FmdE family protein [Methanobacteriaceae archaeon]|nr:FmdE family protein [Methanobacteriaceae archaeon]MDP2836856.1 FmdE family protein [Methanobacteriaceae archaeon]MDP3034516.1 FmdE family protein [Methanobacteriaceae archaeon]MDP3485079.1 FmdE family protein [Methanobacteriaceae archaeon]MDP3623869.1 FmdE family protein [Methanobacteriaceae archaeon]
MQRKSDNTKNNEDIKDFSEVTDFHGHVCPGSALGYKAAQMGINMLSSTRSEDEEILTIVENDSCAVDAIQVLTGCTFGKGNLIFNDYGKQVYTFLSRSSGQGIRISLKDSFEMDKIDPQLSILRKKVSSGQASASEKELLNEKVQSVANKILEMDGEEIFIAEKVNMALPPKASIFKSINCQKCGELVSEHRMKEVKGIKVCIPCSKE